MLISLTAFGCMSFVDDSDKGNGGGSDDTTVVVDETAGGTAYTNLPSSATLAQNVTVNYGTNDQPYALKSDAINAVYTSAVAIGVSTNTKTSWGSGVVVDVSLRGEDDQNVFYVLTCHHVISGKGDLSVYLMDKEQDNYGDVDYDKDYIVSGTIDNKIHNDQAVTLVGGDAVSDIALLRVDFDKHLSKVTTTKPGKKLTLPVKAKLSNRALSVGEDVFAIGNSLGEYPGHTSCGQISYIGRTVDVGSIGKMELLQLDMNTYPGNSGGGLYNLYGELVGITNAGNTDNPGINFAIPARTSKDVAGVNAGFESILVHILGSKTANNYGYITGRWQLGVTVQNSTQEQAYVNTVVSGSNAYDGGMKQGDVITQVSYIVNGKIVAKNITNTSSFSNAMLEARRVLKAGDSMSIFVKRSTNGYYSSPSKKLTINLINQNIFCDTGVYA